LYFVFSDGSIEAKEQGIRGVRKELVNETELLYGVRVMSLGFTSI
jgi:hypothetical protein